MRGLFLVAAASRTSRGESASLRLIIKPVETSITFALNERGVRPKLVKDRGRALATRKVDHAGPHQVNLLECPGAASVIDCTATPRS